MLWMAFYVCRKQMCGISLKAVELVYPWYFSCPDWFSPAPLPRRRSIVVLRTGRYVYLKKSTIPSYKNDPVSRFICTTTAILSFRPNVAQPSYIHFVTVSTYPLQCFENGVAKHKTSLVTHAVSPHLPSALHYS